MAKPKLTEDNHQAPEQPPPTTELAIPAVVDWRDKYFPLPQTPIHQCPTSLDLTTESGRMRLFNARAQQTIDLDSNGTVTLDVIDYMIHPVVVINKETGEEEQAVRTVLISPDGGTYATTSPFIVRDLAEMLQLFDGKRFDHVVRLVVTERKARRSKQVYHSLTFFVPKE